MPAEILGFSTTSLMFWVTFHVIIFIAIYVDLFLLNKENHNNNMRLNLWTVAMWMVAGLSFGGLVWSYKGPTGAMNYWTGYLLEQSLSVDNLFVFLVLFQYFKVNSENQRRALVWGILAAIVMRGVFIFAGVALVGMFSWMLYPLGAFLIYTGIKLLKAGGDDHVDPAANPALRFCRRFLPISPDYVGNHFTTRIDGKFFFTPLFVVLIVINFTDVMFATDSIPAIIGVTTDPFIVYTSNIFAVCGLRAMYFALSGLFDVFYLLKYGLALVLTFIGVKMLAEYPLEHYLHVERSTMTAVSLGVVVLTLLASVLLSLVFKRAPAAETPMAEPAGSDGANRT